jgi:hypothetical protein
MVAILFLVQDLQYTLLIPLEQLQLTVEVLVELELVEAVDRDPAEPTPLLVEAELQVKVMQAVPAFILALVIIKAAAAEAQVLLVLLVMVIMLSVMSVVAVELELFHL